MAVASRHLCWSLLQRNICSPAKRKCVHPFTGQVSRHVRLFGTCTTWRDQSPSGASSTPAAHASSSEKKNLEDELSEAHINLNNLLTPANPITVSDFGPDERADYETLSKPAQERYIAIQNHYRAALDSPETEEEFERLAAQIDREADIQGRWPRPPLTRPDPGAFWADDEDDEFGQVEDDDDEFKEEHITTVAESELEGHREVREYMRIAAWDMPLLRQFAKPFEPPPLTSPLRFRYTTYMGESHPAARKVVVQFCTKDLQALTPQQRTKLIKLVGVRYNPDTDVVKMSCEKFDNPAQNKRYLGDLVGKLIAEAKDPSDMFEDIPLDFRHHKSKKKPVYPEEWKMKPERVQQLLQHRQQVLQLEDGKPPVDGRQVVEQYVNHMPKRSAGALM